MTYQLRVFIWLLSCIFWLFPFSASAQSKTLSVNCNASGGPLSSITGALSLLDPSVPNTLNVSGTCNENIVIQSFERLTLNAINGASINDASGGNNPVVDFEDSKGYLNGFTVVGGSPAVLCSDFSQCRFQSNTIEQGFPGVNLSGQAFATFNGDTIQDGGRGLGVANGSYALLLNVTISHTGIHNAGDGIFVGYGSTVSGNPVTIQNSGGNGVHVIDHGTFRMSGGTISGNQINGVLVEGLSEATFQSNSPISITGNAVNGVQVNDLSFARFVGAVTVTSNAGGVDVNCSSNSAARGAGATGGSTNCAQ